MLKIAVKIGISATLIWLLARGLDGEALARQLLAASPSGPIAAVAVLFVLSMVQAWRWVWVFRSLGRPLGFGKCWTIVLIGLFFNQTLPSAVGGDAARVWRVYRAGYPPWQAASSVLLDRLSALVALLLLSAAGLPVLFRLTGSETAAWALAALVAAGFAGCCLLLAFDRLPGPWTRLRAGRALARLAADARGLLLRPGLALPVLLLSLAIHVFVALVVFVIARSMGISVGALACILLVPPVILLTMIPVTIAGWGVREGAMVVALGFVGVPADSAFALSVMFGLAVMAAGLPGGAVWLLSGRREPRVARLADLASGWLRPRGGGAG